MTCFYSVGIAMILRRAPEHNERVGRFKLMGQIGTGGGGGGSGGEIKSKIVQ